MAIYRIHRASAEQTEFPHRELHRRRAVVAIVIGLAVIAVPLAFTSVRIASNTSTESTVQDVATTWAKHGGWEVASVATQPQGVLVRVTGPSPAPDTETLDAALTAAGVDDVTVQVELIPSTSVELRPGTTRAAQHLG